MKDTLLANQIAEKIAEKIKNGEYQSDAKLTVRLLCEQYKVSETPIKQALNQLEGKGLVVAIPKCGVKVKSFDFNQMKYIWQTRLMIEIYAAEATIHRAKEKKGFVPHFKKLLECTDAEYAFCMENFTRENFLPLGIHDHALHLEIVESTENPVIIDMYENLHAHEQMFVGFDVHTPATLRTTIAQHDKIGAAIADYDLDGLRSALSEHIETTIEIYQQHNSSSSSKRR